MNRRTNGRPALALVDNLTDAQRLRIAVAHAMPERTPAEVLAAVRRALAAAPADLDPLLRNMDTRPVRRVLDRAGIDAALLVITISAVRDLAAGMAEHLAVVQAALADAEARADRAEAELARLRGDADPPAAA